MTVPPTIDEFAMANNVIHDLNTYAHEPCSFIWAWETLKAARGQSVDFDRIGPPAYLIKDNTPKAETSELATALASHSPSIIAACARRMNQMGAK
ncbi:MAG: hypothetical protein ABJL67_13180 [Sulfitobacter sp.]